VGSLVEQLGLLQRALRDRLDVNAGNRPADRSRRIDGRDVEAVCALNDEEALGPMDEPSEAGRIRAVHPEKRIGSDDVPHQASHRLGPSASFILTMAGSLAGLWIFTAVW
jgi:hypothetical protein